MKKLIVAGIAAALLQLSALPVAAEPDNQWHGGPDNPHWDPSASYHDRDHDDRRLGRDDYVHRGGDGRYYCRRSDGTTGLVIGGLGGAAIGGALGGSTVAALLGAAGGAAIGSSIDRGEVHCR
jgi:hypothetical protein